VNFPFVFLNTAKTLGIKRSFIQFYCRLQAFEQAESAFFDLRKSASAVLFILTFITDKAVTDVSQQTEKKRDSVFQRNNQIILYCQYSYYSYCRKKTVFKKEEK